MSEPKKKYVVVLAHADGWGAMSANKVLRHLHKNYPKLDVYLVVSKATRNKDGEIATKLDDLKKPRQLKETDLLKYFDRIDALYDGMPSLETVQEIMESQKLPEGVSQDDLVPFFINLGRQHAYLTRPDCLTFKQLAKRNCADGAVHYTSRGGPKGGEEVKAVVDELEKKYGKKPEVLLSVDTMAILPKELLERSQCFSTHPGPLDDVKVEGMQGTLRSLVHDVVYDADGKPLDHAPEPLETHFIKGTLFMQHPELDKGPQIQVAYAQAGLGISAYEARDKLYDGLTDRMLAMMPKFLDKSGRGKLVERATRKKQILATRAHTKIPELEEDALREWQGGGAAFHSPGARHGVVVFQNEIVSPAYFRKEMSRFFPGSPDAFEQVYQDTFGATLAGLEEQMAQRLTEADPWASYLSGNTGFTISSLDTNTGKVLRTYKNKPRTK